MNRSNITLAGLIVLVIGLAIAESIDWFGESAAAANPKAQQTEELANAILLENQRKADHDIEMGFGKVYVLLIHGEEWWMGLPGYQQVALSIAGVTVLISGTCFIVAAQIRRTTRANSK